MTYIEQQQPGVLCPQDPTSERHREWVRVQNAIYSMAARDVEGEVIDEEDYRAKIKEAALEMGIHSETPDYMNLYRATALTSHRAQASRNKWVQAWFFKCPVCHFVLPAQDGQR